MGNWDKFNRYVAPQIEKRRAIAKFGYDGIVQPYNEILDTVQGWDDVEALILLHDDLEMLDPDGERKLVEPLVDPDVAMTGVAGGGFNSIYWWNWNPIGHQQTDNRLIDFGRREGEVTLLEGSIMALSPWFIQNLRFDDRFTWFHGYDEIGMQVRAAGKKALVMDVDTHHHNTEGYASEYSAEMCRLADQLYREKWGLG